MFKGKAYVDNIIVKWFHEEEDEYPGKIWNPNEVCEKVNPEGANNSKKSDKDLNIVRFFKDFWDFWDIIQDFCNYFFRFFFRLLRFFLR